MAEPEPASSRSSPAAVAAAFGAVVLALTARSWHLATYGLWMDEVFSLRIARSSWSELISQTAADAVHPPLFYIVLKIWIAVGGDSIIWLKLLPLLFGIAAIAAIFLLIKELRLSLNVLAVTLLLVALNAYLIYYAQELRMYSLLMLLSVLSAWAFVRFVNGKGRHPAIILFAVNLLMVYTHYFGWLTVGAEGIALIVLYRERWKPFTLQCLGLIAAFIPWAFTVMATVSARGSTSSNVAWIDRPPLLAVPVFLADLEGHFSGVRYTISIGMAIFLVPVVLWLWQGRRDADTRRLFVLLGSLTVIPIAAAFLLSQITGHSVWVDRYLIATAVPFAVLLAVAATSLRPRALSAVCLVLMIGWSLGAGTWNLLERRERVDWTALTLAIASNTPAPVYVTEQWAELPLAEGLHRAGSNDEVLLTAMLDEITANEFWFAYRSSTWKGERSAEQTFAARGCSTARSFVDRTPSDEVHLLLVQCTPK